MTEKKRRILRYAIAVDLVILGAAIGWLLPGRPLFLMAVFAAAVLLSAWMARWSGGAVTAVLSVVTLATLFRESYSAMQIVGFAAVSLASVAVVRAATMRGRVVAARPATAGEPANVVTFVPPPVEAEPEPEPAPAPVPLVVEPQRKTKKGKRAQKIEEERERAALAKKLEEEKRAAEEAAQRKIQEEKLAAEEAARRKIEAEKRAAEEAAERRIEEEKRAAEAAARRKLEEERAAIARAAEEEAQRKIEAEKRAAEESARRKLEEERSAIARAAEEDAQRKIEVEKRAAEEAARTKLEEERVAIARAAEEKAQRKIEVERRAAEEAAQRTIEEERAARARAEEERAALARKFEEERRAAEEAALRKLEEEREALRRELQEKLAAEEAARVAVQEKLAAEEAARRKLEEERAAMQKQLDARKSMPLPKAQPKTSIFGAIGGFFRPKPAPAAKTVNLKPKKPADRLNESATRRPSKPADRRPRVLMVERRRGTADTIIPKLRQKGIEAEVVERWIDAVDEIFRFRPDVLFIDSELAEFEKVYRSIADHHPNMPIYLTGRSSYGFVAPQGVRYVGFITRPYDADQVTQLTTQAKAVPDKLLAQQTAQEFARHNKPATIPVAKADPPKAPPEPLAAAPQRPAETTPKPLPPPTPLREAKPNAYETVCFNCRVVYDAMDADWCSCLTKERTLVCTNCLTCFCKAPPAYKEKFWVQAPPPLFERRSSEARKVASLPPNPGPDEVIRPLVLSVEDDEEIQHIVQRVCTNLGYGFVYATNGHDGLQLARLYRPNLILSDAFMPKLDGREMCRILKQEAMFADCRMIIMTGLYTDTKYRSEALKRFHVDDYLAKPVAITDLINLLQKYLEGVTGLPQQEDLHALHRQPLEDEAAEVEGGDVPLADLLDAMPIAEEEELEMDAAPLQPRMAVQRRDTYEVRCFNCSQSFDATHAEWCSCVGRDQTLLCPHCHVCFCKAPAQYKERFWMDAPPSLFERKMLGSKRALAPRTNPTTADVKRPLILLVEDDENVQLIVRTVVTSMGYGFIVGANGQEGLALAREYTPDLILSDAFMPKLDGREMCRLLKEDPSTARAKAIIMTGLYTDRKYRNEALDYFRVDDYVAKPLAVDDLIRLFKKHLPLEVPAARPQAQA